MTTPMDHPYWNVEGRIHRCHMMQLRLKKICGELLYFNDVLLCAQIRQTLWIERKKSSSLWQWVLEFQRSVAKCSPLKGLQTGIWIDWVVLQLLDMNRDWGKDKYLRMDTAERRRDTQKPTFAAQVLMFGLGPGAGMSLKRVEVEVEEG